MKLLGRDISTAKVLAHVEARLKARGLADQGPSPIDLSGVEARVDPAAFYLEALAEHADATRGLPLDTHRTGLGRAVLLAKWGFRRTCQVFINEALSRQRLFNGHVRDAYAQLSADVLALKTEVEALRRTTASAAPARNGAAAVEKSGVAAPAKRVAAAAEQSSAADAPAAPGGDGPAPGQAARPKKVPAARAPAKEHRAPPRKRRR